MEEMGQALWDFFTSDVDLPDESRGTSIGRIYWETRNGWRYPWRMVSFEGGENGAPTGYPCGEPEKVK